MLAATGRLFFRDGIAVNPQPVIWEEGEPWKLWLEVRQDERDQWNITGSLRRGEERMELQEPLLLFEGGFVLASGGLAPLDDGGAFPWITQLRHAEADSLPRSRTRDGDEQAAGTRRGAADGDGRGAALRGAPRPPRTGAARHPGARNLGRGVLSGAPAVRLRRADGASSPPGRGIWLPEERVYLVRDTEAENAAQEKLQRAGPARRRQHDALRLPIARPCRAWCANCCTRAGTWRRRARHSARPGATQVST